MEREFIFKALQKGDVMQEDDYIADEDGIYLAGKSESDGRPWRKSYYPRYRKVST